MLIKLGEKGCVAHIDGTGFGVTALRVAAVDTVGAGDAFAAGYLAELLADRGATDRLDTATRAGALACLGHGDWESIPRRADLTLLEGLDPVIR